MSNKEDAQEEQELSIKSYSVEKIDQNTDDNQQENIQQQQQQNQNENQSESNQNNHQNSNNDNKGQVNENLADNLSEQKENDKQEDQQNSDKENADNQIYQNQNQTDSGEDYNDYHDNQNKKRPKNKLSYERKNKNSQQSKKNQEDEEKKKQQTVDQVKIILEKMNKAYENDIQANKKNQPAINKRKYIDQLFQELKKVRIQEEFLEQNGLDYLAKWLEKLPDGSETQTYLKLQILKIVQDLDVDKEQLQQSQLGKHIYPLRKTKNREIQNLAQHIVDKWTHIILGKRADYSGSDVDE